MSRAARSVLLLGNVKVGKSALFERLTSGACREVRVNGNATAVREGSIARGLVARLLDGLRGRLGRDGPRETDREDDRPCGPGRATCLIDPPGVLNLVARGEDEQANREVLLSGRVDAILMVADAKNLRRSLALFVQAAEFGLPAVLDLNMMDEAAGLGLSISPERLAERLGVEVNTTVAIEDQGTGRLPRLLDRACVPRVVVRYHEVVESALTALEPLLARASVRPRALALLLLVGEPRAAALVAEELGSDAAERAGAIVAAARASLRAPLELAITEAAYAAAERLLSESAHREANGRAALGALGRAAEHPVLGIPIALAVLGLAYLWIGELGATLVVDVIDRMLFQEQVLPMVERAVAGVPWPLAREALVDPDFGLIPTGLFLAVGIVLPVLFFFYFFFAVLEDSGYLPRLSVLLDRILRRMGLNGKGVLPLVLGLSCVTMALITTRMLETRKERIIASFLLLLSFPCAPLIAVMFIVLQPLHWSAAVTVFGFLAVQVVVAGVVANRVIAGKKPEFILEIPPLRRPRLRVILVRTGQRTYRFLREALPIFLLASLVLFGLDRLGGLDLLERVSRPVVNGMLGLPDQAVQVFIKTFIRRENGAAELNVVGTSFDGVQLVVSLLVMTLLTPCVNSAIVLFKERGLKVAVLMLAMVMVYALLAGGAVNLVCRGLGVSFV